MRTTLPFWTTRVLAVSTLPLAGSISTRPAWTKVVCGAWAQAVVAMATAASAPRTSCFTGNPQNSEGRSYAVRRAGKARRRAELEQDQREVGRHLAGHRRPADVRVEAALALAEAGVLIAGLEGEPAPAGRRAHAPVAARAAVLGPVVPGQRLQGHRLVDGIVRGDFGAPDLLRRVA